MRVPIRLTAPAQEHAHRQDIANVLAHPR
jgi:hypothetical protein